MKVNLERLNQIEEIYHAVLEIPVSERAAFFRKNCEADADLRREVESLLAFDEKTSENFLDAPPESLAAEMFAERETETSLVDREIGRYRIERLLGRGGMGEVYLSEDTNLNRKVALKFLSDTTCDDKNLLRRFKQEAFAASALNHPNILTIYEFDTTSEVCFLATEYIEGETLREVLNRERLMLKDALSVVEQIAFALAAAHKAKIIHRDIKPENIMLREDGFAKILDFGLAKLTEKPELHKDADQKLTLTRPGALMGTVSYMSPEQVRGRGDIDARTDVWSLGVVLFEMLAGRVPFAGETAGDTIAAILKSAAPPLSKTINDCPPELERIVDKALAKNVEERYQTMQDFALDIKNLKRRLEFETDRNSSTIDRNKPRFPLAISASILLVILIGGAVLWKFSRAESNVQTLTIPSSAVPEAALPQSVRSLNYSLTVQSYNDGRYKSPFRLSGEMLFRNKDRIRLNVKSPQTGFLYILNESPPDSAGKTSFNILFPSPTTNDGTAQLSAGQEIQIPQQSWFELDAKEGSEIVWLVWSGNAVSELESAKRFANPTDRGKIKDAALAELIESLLKKYQSNKADVVRNDDRKESQITANADILAHIVKLEHH